MSDGISVQRVVPPAAARAPQRSFHHGQERIDDFAWLRDPHWSTVLQAPETLRADIRAHLEAENAYAVAALAPVAELAAELAAELRARLDRDDVTVPLADGAYAYHAEYRGGAAQPSFYRTPVAGGASELLFDGPRAAAGLDHFRIGEARHSPDHALFAVSADRGGGERFTLTVYDAASRALVDEVDGTDGQLVWLADGRTLLYVALDEQHRPRRVRRRRVGRADDTLVYEETDPAFFVRLGRAESGDFVTWATGDHQTNELWLLDARRESAPRCLLPRRPGRRAAVAHDGRRLFFLHNDQAPDYQISDGDGQTVVPHRPGVLLREQLALGEHLVRLELADALPRLVVRRLSDGAEHTVAFDDEAYELVLTPGFERPTRTLRFTYSSPRQPPQVFDYDVETRERRLRKEEVVPGHDPSRYRVRRLHARASDGELVPITLLAAADRQGDALWLHAYGAYGVALPARFDAHLLGLVERGFAVALGHVRGGRDRGQRWYDAGRGARKPASFSDLIAVAEQLIADGHTRAGRVVAHGGSAGGLLVGAVLNLRPELFGAAVAEVPFVDALASMLDETLPLTPREYPEWGDPQASAEAYGALAAYSPVDNVAPRAYPHLLVTAGVSDPRVPYWEPARWVARLRAAQTGGGVLALCTDLHGGHLGRPGRLGAVDEVARRQAFALGALAGALG